MIIALRYIEKEDGYWEVQTEKEIKRHTSLRHFQEEKALTPLATRAIQEPGLWIEVKRGASDAEGE